MPRVLSPYVDADDAAAHEAFVGPIDDATERTATIMRVSHASLDAMDVAARDRAVVLRGDSWEPHVQLDRDRGCLVAR